MLNKESLLLEKLNKALKQVKSVILGKSEVVDLCFCAILSGGHTLIEDLPGLGKTTLAKSMSKTLGLDFQRLQCTSDLMPSDVIGVSVFNQKDSRFEFHKGPIFSQFLLVDEINRASPRTQSALLEAMAENQISIDNHKMVLKKPFFIIATQNPIDYSGTFPLPDSQLDRFLFKISLGYPDEESEFNILKSTNSQSKIDNMGIILSETEVLELIQLTQNVQTSDKLIRYVLKLVKMSRNHPYIQTGLSPRAGLYLLNASKAIGLLKNRSYVIPEDIKSIFEYVCAHRITLKENCKETEIEIINQIIETTEI